MMYCIAWGTGLMTLGQSAATSRASMTVLDYIRAGGVIGYVLLILSFIALGLLIAFSISLRRTRLMPPELVDHLGGVLRAGDIQGAIAVCRDPDNDSFITRVVGGALLRCIRSPFGTLELRAAVEESGQREVDKLYRTVDPLGILAAVGPMLGLLGTVFGMIGAFATIGELEGAARSQQLSKFMSIALVTTAEGLLVAIPCTIAFSIFRRKIDTMAVEAAQVVEGLVAPLESSGGGDAKPAGKVGPSARPSAARVG
ncbi:MAG TPA: MotA/TolQ/ExbB proton channel family protein [Phycisphaerales bacterium]|nr:MotA/TolQ/ExbB proton channel family protein [Phycisphaerales bacterium]